MLSRLETATLWALAEHATPGPWHFTRFGGVPLVRTVPTMHGGKGVCGGMSKANGAYIAALSPDVVMNLLAHAEAQAARLERLKSAVLAYDVAFRTATGDDLDALYERMVSAALAGEGA